MLGHNNTPLQNFIGMIWRENVFSPLPRKISDGLLMICLIKSNVSLRHCSNRMEIFDWNLKKSVKKLKKSRLQNMRHNICIMGLPVIAGPNRPNALFYHLLITQLCAMNLNRKPQNSFEILLQGNHVKTQWMRPSNDG